MNIYLQMSSAQSYYYSLLSNKYVNNHKDQ